MTPRPLAWVPDAVIEPHEGGAVVLDSRSFSYVELDRTGAAMWRAVADTADIDAALDLLVERYDVSRDVLERDLLVFVDRLAAQGFVAAPGEDDDPGREPPTPIERYLDLVERSLVGLLPGSRVPSRHGHHLGVRAQGRDLSGSGITLIGLPRLRHLRLLVERVIREEVPGDLIECGIWRGGAVIMMRAVLAAHGVTDRTVWAADSFAGLPPATMTQDQMWQGYGGVLAVDLDTVQANVAGYGLLDAQVRFLPGWFRDTLPGAPVEHLALLRLDGDLYESTRDTLEALHHKLSPGGFVVVDDWALESCRAACEDFRAAHGITAPVEPVDWCGAFWQVPLTAS